MAPIYTNFVDEYADKDKDLEKARTAICLNDTLITEGTDSFASNKVQM